MTSPQDPLELLAEARQALPSVRQALVEAIPHVADAQVGEQIRQVIAAFDEHFPKIEKELPVFLAQLQAEQEQAQAGLRGVVAKLDRFRSTLVAESAPPPAADSQAPPPPAIHAGLGQQLRDGLFLHFEGAAARLTSPAPAPAFEDWTDSLVSFRLPVDGPYASPPASFPPTVPAKLAPSSFESWLSSGQSAPGEIAASETAAAKEAARKYFHTDES